VLTREIPPIGFRDALEERGYLETFRRTEGGAAVYPLSGGMRFAVLAGLDRACRPWLREELELGAAQASESDPWDAERLVDALQKRGYRYLVVDPSFQDAHPALAAQRLLELEHSVSVREVVRLRQGGETFALYRLLGSNAPK
jgi:hypothetical protein